MRVGSPIRWTFVPVTPRVVRDRLDQLGQYFRAQNAMPASLIVKKEANPGDAGFKGFTSDHRASNALLPSPIAIARFPHRPVNGSHCNARRPRGR